VIDFSGINWLAVLFGTILSMGLGALWYGPFFGKLWLNLIGKTIDELESNPLDYLKTALAALIGMISLSIVVSTFGANSIGDGLLVGLLVGMGFSSSQTFVYTTFEGPKESIWLLYSLYQITLFVSMGIVFAVW
jgi:hypothetical protein